MLQRALILAQQFDDFEEFDLEIDGALGAIGVIFMLVYLAVIVLVIAAMWKMFTKANEPGWAAIVPIYGAIVLLKLAGKPWWWFLLLMIPLVNIVLLILVSIDLARNFGKGGGFAVGLIFLPFIFYPILGFGDARYQPVTTA